MGLPVGVANGSVLSAIKLDDGGRPWVALGVARVGLLSDDAKLRPPVSFVDDSGISADDELAIAVDIGGGGGGATLL